MKLRGSGIHSKYLFFNIIIILGIVLILIYISITSHDRYIWQTKSEKEIAAAHREIIPVPESILVIPEFDGKYPVPIIEFGNDHFMESWYFMIYNDGSMFLDGQYVKKIPLVELQTLILELNNIGLYDINEWVMIHSLKDMKKMTVLDVILPRPDRPFVPAVVIDGGTNTIRIYTNKFKYYSSFYAVDYYHMEFPTSQEVRIVWASIDYLRDSFRKFMKD